MKYTMKKTLALDFTLDSSEMIMFTKGGRHTMDASFLLGKYDDDPDGTDLTIFNELLISFQMQRNEQGRFDHITSEAAKHRAQWDGINEREKQ